MTWLILAVCGAGVARAVWALLSAYERMSVARDELDDSLRPDAPDLPDHSAQKAPRKTADPVVAPPDSAGSERPI